MIKPLKRYSVLTAYITLPFHKITAKSTFKLLSVIVKDFFLLQFFVKWGIKKISIVSVDHPLDRKVPFTPKRVGIYFDFINIWIRPLAMLIKKFGLKRGLPLCREWLDRLKKTYKEAAKFYRFRLSTTARPKYKKSLPFLKIHLFDPHYCCVPSLHIAIVVLVFTFYRDLFMREGFSAEERDAWNEELYKGAVAIGETVLYVKQHSVNCIPAALYMMTRIQSDLVTIGTCVKYIEDLFKEQDDIAESDKIAIQSHIQYMYERFYLEGLHFEDWREPVQRWILSYGA